MGDRRKMQQTVRASGDCRVDKNRIFKAFDCYDIRWFHILHLCQTYRLSAGFSGKCQKDPGWWISTRGFPEVPVPVPAMICIGCGSDKGAGAAAPDRRILPSPALLHRSPRAQIFALYMPKAVRASAYPVLRSSFRPEQRPTGYPPHHTDQVSRNTLITTRQIDPSIERSCIGVDLDHICNHLAACKACS